MRPVRVDLVWTTDANGNATIKIPLPFTGAWYNLKFSLSMSAAAEWAVLLSGTPVTYGRGRRVTLGPELIQDGETVTINVSGGPVNAQGTGAASGIAGLPEEMLSSFAPQPNTIALDAALRPILLGSFSSAGAGTVSKSFPIPPGTASIGFAFRRNAPNVIPNGATLTGDQTNITYLAAPDPLGLPASAILDPQDTSVTLSLTPGGGNTSTADVLAWPEATAVAIQQQPGTFVRAELVDATNNPITVFGGRLLGVGPIPTAVLQTDISNGVFPATLVAGIPGPPAQIIRIWGWSVALRNAAAARFVNLRGSSITANDGFANTDLSATLPEFNGNLGGGPLAAGDGLVIDSTALVNEIVRVGVAYSQG